MTRGLGRKRSGTCAVGIERTVPVSLAYDDQLLVHASMEIDFSHKAHDAAEALGIGLRGQFPAGPEAELARVA